jgi:hypothetical protein
MTNQYQTNSNSEKKVIRIQNNQFALGIKDCFVKYLENLLWKRNNKTSTKGNSIVGKIKYSFGQISFTKKYNWHMEG